MKVMADKKTWFFLYLGVACLIYFNSLDNGFHYDDQHVISENRGIQSLSRWTDIWTHRYLLGDDQAMGVHYRPVVYTSYLLNYAIGGDDPLGYHGVNLALHVGTAFLTALILERLSGLWLAGLLGGGLFLLHPFNAEAVNYITARSSQFYAVFFLLAFYAYLRYRERSRSSAARWGWLGICCTAFIFSLLSKEMAVTFPAVLLVYEAIVRRKEGWGERWRGWAIPGGLTLAGSILYLIFCQESVRNVMSGMTLIPGRVTHLDGVSHGLTQIVAAIRALVLIVWPAGLTVDHRVEVYSTLLAWPAAGALALLAGALALLVRWMRSEREQIRVQGFLLAWFFISLVPLAVIPLNAPLQENRVYLAGVGIFGLGAIAIVRVLDWTKSRGAWALRGVVVGLAVVVLVYGGMTIQRNVIWQDEISLWRDALRKNPESSGAHLSLGSAYQQEKEYDRALREYREAVKINPIDFRIHGSLAHLYQQQGNYAGAIEEYLTVVGLAPSDPEGHYRLGWAYQSSGQLDEAMSQFRITLALNPNHERALLRLGKILEAQGKIQEAKSIFNRLLRLRPSAATSSPAPPGLTRIISRPGRTEELPDSR